MSGSIAPLLHIVFFAIPRPKVPTSVPTQKREYGIFGPGMTKNSIRT